MSPARPELEACLEGLHSGGRLDSSGGFTLSREKAVEKLRGFRLAEPRLYVLNLLASGLAGGAEHIEIECDSDDFVLSARGAHLALHELRDLEAHMLSDRSPAALKELAVGYYGAQALKPRRIVVEARHDGRGVRLCWQGGRLLTEDCAPGPAGLRVHVRERLGLRTAGKFVARLAGASRPDSEEDALARHCNLAPVPVRLNGKPLARPLAPGNVQGILCFCDQAPLAAEHPLTRLLETARCPVVRQSSGGPFRGVLCAGGRLGPWLTLVVHGVNFRLATSGPRGVVYADHLQKDLSQARLVQDRAFLDLVERVTELGRSWR